MVGVINCAVLGSSGEWNNGTFRQSPSPAVCSVANYDAKGPYAANRRRLGPHRKPAEYGTTRSTASTPHTLRPPPAASPVPILYQPPCTRRDLVGSLPSNKQPKRTHKQPQTHLEPHDRLADHREQPRRQREQLRRELRVRHTGSDRRRRLPVPHEQHRHEQLEPLRQRIRSSSRTCARPVCAPVAVYH
jgi:hypothetical protein